MLYSINNEKALIKYDKETIPHNTNFIDYLEFEINDFTYILHKDDIENIFGGFIDDYINDYPSDNKYMIFLQKLDDMLQDIDAYTLEDLYGELEEPDTIEMDEWFHFHNNFFNEYFPNKTPQEIAEIVYFSNINSWNDQYVRFTGKGRLQTADYIDYSTYSDEILAQWVCENFKNY